MPGRTIADGYVELRLDDSKLDVATRNKAQRVAKDFGTKLNSTLAALSIDPIDMKADPKHALASIDKAEARLQVLSRDAASVELKFQADTALAEISRLKKRLGEVGAKPIPVEADPSPARQQLEMLRARINTLGIEPFDLDADPKQALAAIDRVGAQLAQLRDESTSVHVRVDAEQARSQLARLHQQLKDAGDDGAGGFAESFAAKLPALLEKAPISPGLLAAVLGAMPLISGAIAAGVVGSAAGGGITGGILIAAKDPRVKSAAQDLGQEILADLQVRAGGFVQPLLDGFSKVRDTWAGLGPDLDRVFQSSRFIDPLLKGLSEGGRDFVRGFADAIDKADPVIQAIADLISRTGTSVGDFFSAMADHAQDGASAIEDLTDLITGLISVTSGIVGAAAEVQGWTDSIDQWSYRMTFALENTSHHLDITADGFRKGTPQAQAFRDMILGTADAQDVATLRAAGMTDAQIRNIDATKRAVAEADAQAEAERRRQAALEVTGERLLAVKGSEENVKAAQTALTEAQKQYKLVLDALAPSMGLAKQQADGLKQAEQALYGAAIAGAEANEAYHASWDGLTDSIKQNKNSLNIHTAAGRANRDALEALLQSSNQLYYADIAAGVSIDSARKKHEARTRAVEKEAGKLKLNRTETQGLIDTYGRIPGAKTTDIVIEGVREVVRRLYDLYILQRSLATGRSVSSIEDTIRKGSDSGPAKRAGGYATGGLIDGPGTTTSDSVTIRASRKEYIHNAGAVDYYGVRAMDDINAKRIPASVLRGYAAGGLVAPVDTSRRWPYPVDVADTFVMSRQQAIDRVTPPIPTSGATAPALVRILHAAFPGLRILSTYREGARTLSGAVSYHALNRAVDTEPDYAAAKYMFEHYLRVLKEAITPWQQFNVHNGSPHHYSGDVYAQHAGLGRFRGNRHNHFAADDGGYLMPGWNTVYNGTGVPEPVIPSDQLRGGDVHIHLHNAVVASERQFEDLVARAWNRAVAERKIKVRR